MVVKMNERDQTQHFSDDLDALINRYRTEYDISYAAVLGALQMKIWLLCYEAKDAKDNE